ncbi:Uncharacterized conserved protein YndB, AHSA1/START domain [Mucilaginibacter pineti]|uniref:Uncharacterized conserved protein YndB, AHSA1/START domain n=1 Tax=Mucilaginibacter pineti TaxID=1391627 RepID=A0A1G6UIL7_9SPHI|nr:SRPBCC domain-containing protein [Mucilaginibacter pineti]SDD41228.1 Uncharacterized conserved protein YndB, AHSA1/START domain [Mucilaginibacter pineti]
MAKIIKHQLFYPHPPAVVWDYLTNAELIAQWLMKSNFLPIVGHDFQFKAKPMPELDFDGIFYCKVLEVVPFTKLSYSWKFGPGDGTLNNSVVNWTLTEKDNGTELLLIHNGFEGTSLLSMFASMNEGWLRNIKKILQLINDATNGTTQA